MDSVELYRQLLGVTAPWAVQRVDMDVHGLRVDVHLEDAPGARFACPQCGRECGVYDHAAERSWRHLDSCHFQTVLLARAPRVNCLEHGVRLVELPWAEPGGRFTRLFEALAIDVLLATDVKKAATILGITWDEAWHIMERAVVRGRRAKPHVLPEMIGLDEKAIAKGHRYMTLVCDLEQATVEYIAEDRKQASLDAYFDAFDAEALQALRAVCMDMWPPYINACHDRVEQVDQKIVFDRFHILRHVIDAVDTVRKREHKALLSAGDATLRRSKYLWLYSAENVPSQWRQRFDELKGANLKTARAWALKETHGSSLNRRLLPATPVPCPEVIAFSLKCRPRWAEIGTRRPECVPATMGEGAGPAIPIPHTAGRGRIRPASPPITHRRPWHERPPLHPPDVRSASLT